MPGQPSTEPRENLPRPLTRFIGRAEELQSLGALVRTARLITLTGFGGCGKTRLAREVAASTLADFPGGTRWAGLGTLTDGALIPQTIAAAWGVVEQTGRPILETLAAALAPLARLLVLDNCEHLLDSSAHCAQFLLDGCPELILLTTSREPLGIAGEIVVPIVPLPVPEERPQYDVSRLANVDAISLFVERARVVAPSFALTSENAQDVVRICRKLDGIPLALELAAARARLLSSSQIAERLDHAFRVLGGGSRTAPPRQQTLRATLDWSYGLLSPAEAALFRCLSVFAGSFTLEAMDAVCAAPEAEPDDMLNELGRLVDKSLVLTVEHAGEVRYRLLEVPRQYARQKLEASVEYALVCARHAAYYAQMAQQAGVNFTTNDQHLWFDALEREHENLRAAMGWWLEHDDPEQTGMRLASLRIFWLIRGHLAEGCRWLDLALAKLPNPTRARARVLQALAILTFHHQGYAAAAPVVAEALALSQTLDDRLGLAVALLNAGTLAHGHGDYAQAMAYFEQSLPMCSEGGWDHAIALCLASMGFTVLHLGDIPRGLALCGEAVLRGRAVNDLPITAGALTNLGIALLMGQQYEAATARFEESLSLRREIADLGGAAHTLRFLGRAALEQGDPAQAQAYYLESFALRDTLGEDEGLAEALEGLAAVAAARGDGTTAAERLGTAQMLRERAGMPIPAIDRPFYDRWLACIHDLLDEPALTAAWATGRLHSPRAARDTGKAAAQTPASSAPVVIHRPSPAVTSMERPAVERLAAERPAPTPDPRLRPQLSVFALGGPRVYRRDAPVDVSEWTYRRARELLFFLLCRENATKEQIGLALWPDSDTEQLRAQLHPVLHHLRQALGGPKWIVFERSRYQFNRTLEYVFDVETFERHLEHATRHEHERPHQAIRHLEQALKLYRGDFLAGEHESEWLELKREELRMRRGEALAMLGRLHAEQLDHARAAESYRQLIASDPYQEHAYRALMQCLARLGESGQALRTFDGLADLLRREVGAAPAPETAALAGRIRCGEQV